VPDGHPLVGLYLLGCVLAVALTLVHLVLVHVLGWVTKGNIVAANVRKLQAPQPKTPFLKASAQFIGNLLFNGILSWLFVLFVSWIILRLVLNTAREAWSSAPESVEQLLFPLKNNPDLPAESVWAHLKALEIRNGKPLDEAGLFISLVKETPPGFNRGAAIDRLEALDVVKPAVLAQLKELHGYTQTAKADADEAP
jgi:hypothetical protein